MTSSDANIQRMKYPAKYRLFGGYQSGYLISNFNYLQNRYPQRLSPKSSPNSHTLSLVERLESSVASLIAGKADILPYTYNESTVISVVNLVLSEGIDNGRIIAERINEAGYQTKGSKAWDKDIYSAWKRGR